ncbi:MAG: ThiF family adenylyltransferase [Planctomycetaceae bacterium]
MPPIDRYRKQTLFAPLGEAGQLRLRSGRALVVGAGALGSVIAESLVRAGVGLVRLVDRDFVEITNLQRQVLYDEQDVADQLPKAEAAARKLRIINSTVTVEPVVADLTSENIRTLADGVQVIVDGADNFETRFLINDYAFEYGVPWVHGGCVGCHGQVMTFRPGHTLCFRCLMGGVPEPGSGETCDTAGVLGPAVNVIASLQSLDAIRILAGLEETIEPVMTVVDLWEGTFRRLKVGGPRDEDRCSGCQTGERPWLHGTQSARSAVLCGRNAVQITPAQALQLSLEDLEARLAPSGRVTRNPFLVKLEASDSDFVLTVFRDGRAIIQGTEDVGVARSVYSRYIGM